jgi:hypothetical protein
MPITYGQIIYTTANGARLASEKALKILTKRRIYHADGSVGMPYGDEQVCKDYQEEAATWSKVNRVLRGIETP